jgi:hypothetical protein
MTTDPDDILDSLFHGCALAAFVEQGCRQQGWPDPEATRRLAYKLYEDALAERSAARRQGAMPIASARSSGSKCR